MVMEESSFLLPPGFRFHPTDEELITHYLSPKILNHAFVAEAMDVVDLNKCEPWDLPGRAKMGGKEWYFFCQRDRKYPTGTRTNRATVSGYWKATGKDKEIFKGRGVLVGMRKTLVFYLGRAPKGEKSNWVMHEFRVHGKPPTLSNILKAEKNEWVICRVFHKKGNNVKRSSTPTNSSSLQRINSFSDELPDSFILPPLTDPPSLNPVSVDADSFDVKQFLPSSVPMPNTYLYSMIDGNENNDTWSPTLPMSTEAVKFLDPLQPIKKHCKAEQFSNQSILSQDTGLSADRYTEISSVIAKHDINTEDFDIYNMWRN